MQKYKKDVRCMMYDVRFLPKGIRKRENRKRRVYMMYDVKDVRCKKRKKSKITSYDLRLRLLLPFTSYLIPFTSYISSLLIQKSQNTFQLNSSRPFYQNERISDWMVLQPIVKTKFIWKIIGIG